MKSSLCLLTTAILVALSTAVCGSDTTAERTTVDSAAAADTAAAAIIDSTDVDTTTPSEQSVQAVASHQSENNRDIIVVRENLDTVFIFDKSVFRFVAKDWRNNIDIFRQRGYGLAGSSMYGANAIFTGPIRDLAENDPLLADKRFNFSRFAFEPFMGSGGSGYIGLGAGLRLGGGGMGCERKFTSNRFGGDSMLVLNAKVTYGGFLMEKCMLRGRWNLSAGGEIGAGSFNVTLSEQSTTYFSAFSNDGDIATGFDVNDQNGSRSMFFMLEPHAGFTYTFFYFFHVGAAISLPTFMSLEKFSAYTDDYFTVNPGLHIKLIFGNIG